MWNRETLGRAVALFAGDVLLLCGFLLFGLRLRTSGAGMPWPEQSLLVLLGLAGFLVAGLYQCRMWNRPAELLARSAAAAVAWGILYEILMVSLSIPRPAGYVTLAGLALCTAGVVGLRWLFSEGVVASRFRERVLVLGATLTADQMLLRLNMETTDIEILGFVDDRPSHAIRLTNGYRFLGTTRELPEIVAANQAGTIVVALEERRGSFPLEAVLRCKLQGVRIEDWPTFYEKRSGRIFLRNLRPSWLIFSEGFTRTQVTLVLKRVVDLSVSSLFLLLGWPIFLLVSLFIRLESPGPIFFRQERVGQGGRIFTLVKFRTMVPDAEQKTGPVWATEADPRITRVGRWLRTTRLDEFPQIINVLKGEMSFVGPRPERPHFVAQLQEKIPFYSHRHSVKPGITGWAQVRYRYGATVEDAEEKLQYDLYYIKHLSGFLDIRILFATFGVVLFGKGAR
jgi:sugar transferase (PEP-CTERM system associated)